MNRTWIYKLTYIDENGQVKLEFHLGNYRKTYLHTFSIPPNYFEDLYEIEEQFEGREFEDLYDVWYKCDEVEMIGRKRWEDGKPCYEENK